MRFPSNCLIVAVAVVIRHPLTARVWMTRNKHGGLHFGWSRDGKRFEFYAKGRSLRSNFANLLYVGEVREVA